MARSVGSARLAASLDVLAGAPLDSRLVVDTTSDLTAAGTFDYSYVGMPVAVKDEGSIYLLTGADTTDAANWKNIGSGGSAGSGTMLTGTMTAAGWTSGSQTVTVIGLKADSIGTVGLLNTASAAQIEAARDAVITVGAIAANSITFLCENEPSTDIPFGVVIGGGVSGGGSGVPDGGTTGQVLAKLSDADGDADWQDMDLSADDLEEIKDSFTVHFVDYPEPMSASDVADVKAAFVLN